MFYVYKKPTFSSHQVVQQYLKVLYTVLSEEIADRYPSSLKKIFVLGHYRRCIYQTYKNMNAITVLNFKALLLALKDVQYLTVY